MVTGASTAPLSQDATATAVAASPQRTRSENRRSNKPIMEKRRRARINNCLNELKYLILDAMKKDPARHSKLEKADILEMTVKHLEAMQRQQVALAAATDPNVLNKFRAGFTECAGEVGRFPGLEPPVRRRLLQHLATCLNSQQQTQPPQDGAATPPESVPDGPTRHSAAVQVSLVPAGAAAGILVASGPGPLQLVPTRLPNGDIALVLPSVVRRAASPPPLAAAPPTPPPSAAPSTPSASPKPPSPPPLPLSLVMGRTPASPPPPPTPSPSLISPPIIHKDLMEEKPWRPW